MPAALSSVSPRIDSPLKSIDERMVWSHLHGKRRLGDALLEMRAAYGRVGTEPEALVASFLKNRRLLAKHDYLWTHRFRRWLENSFQLKLETGSGSRLLPLNLAWSSLEKVFNQVRREQFEHLHADWEDLVVTIEPRF